MASTLHAVDSESSQDCRQQYGSTHPVMIVKLMKQWQYFQETTAISLAHKTAPVERQGSH